MVEETIALFPTAERTHSKRVRSSIKPVMYACVYTPGVGVKHTLLSETPTTRNTYEGELILFPRGRRVGKLVLQRKRVLNEGVSGVIRLGVFYRKRYHRAIELSRIPSLYFRSRIIEVTSSLETIIGS